MTNKELTFEDLEVGDFVEHTGVSITRWTKGCKYVVLGINKKDISIMLADNSGWVDYVCFTAWKIHKKEIVETKPKFKAMKLCVKDEEHSREIQEYLFSQGYNWEYVGYKNKVFLTGNNWLKTDSVGNLFQSLQEPDSGEVEYQLNIVKTYTLEEVVPETITIDGVEYIKAKVLAALKALN